jgi:hypothetical protein
LQWHGGYRGLRPTEESERRDPQVFPDVAASTREHCIPRPFFPLASMRLESSERTFRLGTNRGKRQLILSCGKQARLGATRSKSGVGRPTSTPRTHRSGTCRRWPGWKRAQIGVLQDAAGLPFCERSVVRKRFPQRARIREWLESLRGNGAETVSRILAHEPDAVK